MVDVVATEPGYFGGARRDPGERFSLPDALWRDEKRRPKWVRLARSGGKADAEQSDRKPSAKAAKPLGNGVQEALGGPDPDWLLPPDIKDSSQPVD